MWYHWLIFGGIAVLIPLLFLYVKASFLTPIIKDEKQKESANRRTIGYILLFWLYDLLYMAIFNQWTTLTYIFGVLAVCIIFSNVAKAFLSEKPCLRGMIPFDLILGVGLSVYLIFLIPNESLQTIVTTIIAALYGGFLTLIGVAWTIKRQDREKKEEERKRAKPIFTFNMLNAPFRNEPGKQTCFHWQDISEQYECAVFSEIVNSNHAVLIIKKVYHDKKWWEIEGNTVVLPDKSVRFIFNFNKGMNNLFIETEDVLGNKYFHALNVLLVYSYPDAVNSNPKCGFTISEIKEITLDEINERIKQER